MKAQVLLIYASYKAFHYYFFILLFALLSLKSEIPKPVLHTYNLIKHFSIFPESIFHNENIKLGLCLYINKNICIMFDFQSKSLDTDKQNTECIYQSLYRYLYIHFYNVESLQTPFAFKTFQILLSTIIILWQLLFIYSYKQGQS